MDPSRKTIQLCLEGGIAMLSSRNLLLWSLVLVFLPAAAFAQWGVVGCSTSDSAALFWWAGPGEEFQVGPEISLLPYGNYPYDAVRRPDAEEVWIPGASGDGVVVIGPDGTILHEIPTGEYPVSVAFNPREDLALVSCRDSDKVDLIDTNSYQVVGSLTIPDTYFGPGNLIYDPRHDRFFLVEWYDDTLFVLAPDGSAITQQIPLGDSLWQVVIDPNFGERVYVTDRSQDVVHVLDAATLQVVQTLPVGDDPWGMDVDEPFLVVSCEDSGDVFLFDTSDWSSERIVLPSGSDPRDVNIATGWVTVGGSRVLAAMAYVTGGTSVDGSAVYVIDYWNGSLDYTFAAPGSNTNVVAVEAQWPLSSGVNDLPAMADLEVQASPNPFNPLTEVAFSLDEAQDVRIAVYDLSGRLVRRLAQGFRASGPQSVAWDGRDRTGRRVASGVYQVRVETSRGWASVKVLLAK